jgi:hypothetical protein
VGCGGKSDYWRLILDSANCDDRRARDCATKTNAASTAKNRGSLTKVGENHFEKNKVACNHFAKPL